MINDAKLFIIDSLIFSGIWAQFIKIHLKKQKEQNREKVREWMDLYMLVEDI